MYFRHIIIVLREARRIHPHQLQLKSFIAEGGEGRIYKGYWRGHIAVAIKMMLRDPHKPEDHGFSNARRDLQYLDWTLCFSQRIWTGVSFPRIFLCHSPFDRPRSRP